MFRRSCTGYIMHTAAVKRGLRLGYWTGAISWVSESCYCIIRDKQILYILFVPNAWTLRATDQKHLESFEMWCWRRMEKISWADHVRNEEVLLRVNEQRNILHEIIKRKANWIGHILRRNCLLKQVIEGKIKGQIEVTRRQGRNRKKLLDVLKDRRGYCELKEEAVDRAMRRNRFARGFGPVD